MRKTRLMHLLKRSYKTPGIVLMSLLLLGACNTLNPKHKSEISGSALSDKALELETQSLAKALSMVSPLSLRVESDRYQTELFADITPSSAEDERRARWIESQFHLAGLLPGGDAPSSWRQNVPLISYHSEGMLSTTVKGSIKTLHTEQGIALWSTTPLKEIRLDRTEVFMISSTDSVMPSIDRNTDLRGKVVLMKKTNKQSDSEQFSWAAHQGAAALFLIEAPEQTVATPPLQIAQTKYDHFTLRSAFGNPDKPLVMGLINSKQALMLFGIADKDISGSNSLPPNHKPNQSQFISVLKIPIHLIIKNSWKECVGTNVIGRIHGSHQYPNEEALVFHTSSAYLDHGALPESSWTNASNFAALISIAHGLSKPGETPSKDIIFVITGMRNASSAIGEDDLAWKWWQLQTSKLQNEKRIFHLDMQTLFNPHRLDNEGAWIKASEHIKQLLEQGYLIAGPWAHH